MDTLVPAPNEACENVQLLEGAAAGQHQQLHGVGWPNVGNLNWGPETQLFSVAFSQSVSQSVSSGNSKALKSKIRNTRCVKASWVHCAALSSVDEGLMK